MRNDPLEPEAPTETPLFHPSLELRGHLHTGALAALAAGGLAVAASFLEMSQGKVQGLTPAHALAWAALLPLYLVLRAYLTLAREASSPGLRRSSQGVFGAILLFNVFDLATLEALPLGGRIAAWTIFGIGLLALLSAPFVWPSEPREVSTETPAAEAKVAPSKTVRTGFIGGLAVGLLVLFKLAAKGVFIKMVLFKVLWKRLFNGSEGLEVLAISVLVLLAGALLLWFAVSKIRLRHRLGGSAALAGWMEILMVVLWAGALAWFVAAIVSAAQQPGMTEQALEMFVDQTSGELLWLAIATTLLWTTVTVWLFEVVRNRFVWEQE